MLSLVIGGASSGKSEYAEELAKMYSLGESLVYIATMIPFDKECEKRINNHRKAREHKGFSTIECYTDLNSIKLPKCSTVLLECLSNLVANETYKPKGRFNMVKETILESINYLNGLSENLVIVSNNIFDDGVNYSKETKFYIKELADINRSIALIADELIEVVFAIPIFHKGEKHGFI